MSELEALVLLVGLALLASTGALAASCLALRSPIEFVLASYVIAWTWLVLVCYALSPAGLLTRAWLLAGLGLGLAAAIGAWTALGRPRPPSFRAAISSAARSIRRPPVLILSVAVALGALYIVALAFVTPSNEYDALSYHLARADFWAQEQALGYIEDVTDPRLNFNPPNAEIGQLMAMLLAGSDRYVALPQLLAYAALILCVAGLARRLAFTRSEAMFAALAFGTLPVIAVQAPGAMNDLLVASFLAVAAFFAAGAGVGSLTVVTLAVALAIGTKLTGFLALPTLIAVAAVSVPPRRWPGLALAGAAGLALGSIWYIVNLANTGELGGDAESLDQRADTPGVDTIVVALRLALGFVDMSGAPWTTSAVFLVVGGMVAGVGLVRVRARRVALSFVVAGVLVAAVATMPLVFNLGSRSLYKSALLLDRQSLVEGMAWYLNTYSDPLTSWYGPLAILLLAAGTGLVVAEWVRGSLTGRVVVYALAPWALLLTLALTIVWDPWRGRFLVFGVALAAATWGVVLRSRALATATAVVGPLVLLLCLGNLVGRPSGIGLAEGVWSSPRWDVYGRLNGLAFLHRFVEERVPAGATVALAIPRDEAIHPYFGPVRSRHVLFVDDETGRAPVAAEWVVVAPGFGVRLCPGAWRSELRHRGWSVQRRIADDACFDD